MYVCNSMYVFMYVLVLVLCIAPRVCIRTVDIIIIIRLVLLLSSNTTLE